MMQQIPSLFDPAKPYARFYRDGEDGPICQIHTRKIEGLGFGRVGWRISVSISDEAGATIEDTEGLQIMRGPDGEPYRHEVTIQADSAEDPAAVLEAARIALAEKAVIAAEVWRSAQEVF